MQIWLRVRPTSSRRVRGPSYAIGAVDARRLVLQLGRAGRGPERRRRAGVSLRSPGVTLLGAELRRRTDHEPAAMRRDAASVCRRPASVRLRPRRVASSRRQCRRSTTPRPSTSSLRRTAQILVLTMDAERGRGRETSAVDDGEAAGPGSRRGALELRDHLTEIPGSQLLLLRAGGKREQLLASAELVGLARAAAGIRGSPAASTWRPAAPP